jgi:hypothetical protein
MTSQKIFRGLTQGTRKITGVLGFSKGYNVVLCKSWLSLLWLKLIEHADIIFAGAFMGFALARLQYLDIPGTFCAKTGAAPGECFYYLRGRWRVGILLHLGAILRSC